ncbi:MAG: hypothetical protein IVW52_06380 [Acidimicrobiales bacterium]|nr:hypothetical protein [Acidimicrobiales bacterium]
MTMQSSAREDRQLEISLDAGLSMIATVLSLVATALLVALLLGNALHSGSVAKPSVANAPGVGQTNELQAQQALSTGLTAAAAASATAGGLGSLDISTLSASDPSISFVSGPSVNASTVSVVVASDAAGSGSITMADRSSDGICWLVWRAAGGATWYGAQTGLASCAAPAMTTAPVAGSVSSSAIGWQESSFPAG